MAFKIDRSVQLWGKVAQNFHVAKGVRGSSSSIVWKNEKITLTSKLFRENNCQCNLIVLSMLLDYLISRDFSKISWEWILEISTLCVVHIATILTARDISRFSSSIHRCCCCNVNNSDGSWSKLRNLSVNVISVIHEGQFSLYFVI